jgi:hypothetical protein
VRHVDRGDPELALDRPDLVPEGDSDLRVQGGQRLVEEEDLGLEGERPGKRDPLVLAARELVRVAGGLVAEVDEIQELLTRFRICHRALPDLSPKPTLSPTVMFGEEGGWTIPTPAGSARRYVMSVPSRTTVPAVRTQAGDH